jgi:hypothetical protein
MRAVVADLLNPAKALVTCHLAGLSRHQAAFSLVRNDSVVATKPKSPVTFDVDGVARFTFFRREDGFDRPNKFIAG